MKARNYKIDNLKVLLIFLVVFGHLLEIFKAHTLVSETIYTIIYTFHMGAFLFISGLFARFSFKKMFSLVTAYLIFQPFYRIDLNRPYSVNYVTPQWILWYLFVLILYFMILPILDVKSPVIKVIYFIGSIILSLAIGYFNNVGYYFSISRAAVFLPFFIGGFYSKNLLKKVETAITNKPIKYVSLAVAGIAAISITIGILYLPHLNSRMIYGSYAYAKLGYNICYRLLFIIAGFAWIPFLYLLMPNKNIKGITIVGRNTLSIYLAHGLTVAIIIFLNPFRFVEGVNILLAILIALVLIALYGNKWVAKWISYIATGQFLIDGWINIRDHLDKNNG